MKVLVTGATGFVGSHVVDVLLERGLDVAFIARSTSNMRWLDGKKATRMDGSLYDVASLKKAVEWADAIIHVAGMTSARNEAAFLVGNRDATRNLLDAVRAYNPELQRFVHISTMSVCGPASSEREPLTEASKCHPITAYGRTKKLAEEEVLAVANEIPITIIRPPAVYGPRDSAILTFFQSVAKGIAPLIGFGEKRVSLVHVYDLARGIVDALLSPKAAGQTYFISSEEFYTWPQIASLTAVIMGKRRILTIRIPHPVVFGIAGVVGGLGKLIGKPPVLDFEKGRDITRKFWICSVDKARRDFSYRQQMSLEDGLRNTVNWYREQRWL